jgi:hypothetical protein
MSEKITEFEGNDVIYVARENGRVLSKYNLKTGTTEDVDIAKMSMSTASAPLKTANGMLIGLAALSSKDAATESCTSTSRLKIMPMTGSSNSAESLCIEGGDQKKGEPMTNSTFADISGNSDRTKFAFIKFLVEDQPLTGSALRISKYIPFLAIYDTESKKMKEFRLEGVTSLMLPSLAWN